jgi:hypothetical protein
MKSTTIMVFIGLCLSFGCVTDKPAPLSDDNAGETLAEASQALTSCSSHNDCPVGTYCGTSGICSSAVFGPTPPPTCGSDFQCIPLGQLCTNRNPNLGFYGSCVTPTCSAQYSLSYVPLNGTTYFDVSSNAPAGSYSRLYGTKNNNPDEFGTVYQLASGSFPILNSPGLAGSYMRYLDMYTSDSRLWCRTQPTYTYFAP